MLVTTKGYLLDKKEYQDFDEIITIINEHGIKFSCYCLGTRKITSKNGRNLDYGNFCEFIFFHSTNKLSKLKKVNTLSYLANEYKFNYCLAILNDYFLQIDFDQKKYFDLYQTIILYLMKEINDFLIIIYLCLKIISFQGMSIDLENCTHCHSKNNLNFLNLDQGGIFCQICYHELNYSLKLSLNEKNLLKGLIDNTLDPLIIKVNDYSIEHLRLICLQLMQFIYQHLGLYSHFMQEI